MLAKFLTKHKNDLVNFKKAVISGETQTPKRSRWRVGFQVCLTLDIRLLLNYTNKEIGKGELDVAYYHQLLVVEGNR